MPDLSLIFTWLSEITKKVITSKMVLAVFLSLLLSFYLIEINPHIVPSEFVDIKKFDKTQFNIWFFICGVLFIPIWLVITLWNTIKSSFFEKKAKKKLIEGITLHQRFLLSAIYLNANEANLDVNTDATVQVLIAKGFLYAPTRTHGFNGRCCISSMALELFEEREFNNELEQLVKDESKISEILHRHANRY